MLTDKTQNLLKKLTLEEKAALLSGKSEWEPDLNILFIYNMPFRSAAKMTGGMVSMRMTEGMVTAVNGHFFRGLGILIKGFFQNRKLNKTYAEKLYPDNK